MLNVLLNRYYITNANRSLVLAETQEKVHSLLSNGNIGAAPASGSGTTWRGKNSHEELQRELQGLWTRHLVREEENKDCSGNFCKRN
jgi:hypothetical protein